MPQNLHYKHRVETKKAHHLRHKLLNSTKNDFAILPLKYDYKKIMCCVFIACRAATRTLICEQQTLVPTIDLFQEF